MAGIVDAPRGFIPIKSFSGEVGRVNAYTLAAANALIGKHDMLNLTNAGVVDRAAASDVQIVGVAAESAAASAGTVIRCVDTFGTIFLAQISASGIVATDLNLNANIVVAAAVNGISQMEIDDTTEATTNTLPVKLLRFHNQSGNTVGANVAVECIINNHVLSGNLAGV